MKTLVLLAAAAAAYFAFKSIGTRQPLPAATPAPLPPVDDLAHRLQDAWADHHTVA